MILSHVEHLLYISFDIIDCSTFRVHTYILTPDGITWCAENEIVKGYGEGIFKPNQIVTREELCAILYRYAKYKGLDIEEKVQLSNFTDENEIGNWAKESVSYAVKAQLLKGNDRNQLKPKNQATRAEVATIILNLLKLIEA